MNYFKLTPEQKRQRKKDMYAEYNRRLKNRKITLYDLRVELAEKYGYKTERVVEQTIVKINNDKKQKDETRN